MKRTLIVIALVIILLCSLAVSGIPFNLVVGKEGLKKDYWSDNPQMNFQFEFSKNVFVGKVDVEAFKDWNKCGGKWFAELYDSEKLVSTSNTQDICSYNEGNAKNTGCWRTSDLGFISADKLVIRTVDLLKSFEEDSGCTIRKWFSNLCWSSISYCNPKINMNPHFIEGKKYPFAVSSKSGSLYLGTVDELLGSYVFTETSGTEFKIASDNPRVLVWTGDEYDNNLLISKTSDRIDSVWACYDGDLNNKCDFAEDPYCTAYGGDYYNGVCCGVNVTDDFVSEWNGKTVNALCARRTATDWVWADINNVGEIFDLNYYPGKPVVSDGKQFISCDGSNDDVFRNFILLENRNDNCPSGYSNAFSSGIDNVLLCVNFANVVVNEGDSYNPSQPDFEPAACPSGYDEVGTALPSNFIGLEYKLRICAPSVSSSSESSLQFRDVSTEYGSHQYLCSEGKMFECSGGHPFSTSNVAALGSDSRTLSDFVCPGGMIAYWPMDVNANNDVGDFAHGVSNSVSFVSGKVSQSARFADPSSDIVVSHSSVDISLPSVSVEAWIKPSTLAGKHTIVNKERSYDFYLDGGLLKAVLYSDGSPAIALLTASSSITNDVWSHVALTYDGSTAQIYHNGRSLASASLRGRINSSTSPLRIGARSFSPAEPFEGLIDEVALYSRALSGDDVQSHFSSSANFCHISNITDVYYCASDGDWTKDLDVKDELSCNAAGFNWTGSMCCSEYDDVDESYSDPSSPASEINDILIEQNNMNLVSDYEVVLDSDDSFVKIEGPSKISVVRSSFMMDRGELTLCEEEEISSFVLDQGQSKKIVNYNYPNNDNGCISGRTVVSSLPVQASGGCFHKNFYPSGSFLYEKSVINARGEFVACKQIPGGLQSYSFITTQPSPCGSPIVGVRPGQNAVCLPSGDWHLISDSNITVIDETAWTPSVQSSYRQGCCPEDKCWNGTGCQPADTYYSIDGRGFICK